MLVKMGGKPMGNDNQSHIVHVAQMLVGDEIRSEVIRDVLQYLCETYQFNNGLIYEIDQFNCMQLKEYFGLTSKMKKAFHNDEIPKEIRKGIAEGVLCYVNEDTQDNAFLLPFFNARQVLISPINDENRRIRGLIVLVKDSDMERLDKEELMTLRIAMNMLNRYIGIRVHRKGIEFAEITMGSILDNTGIDIYVNDFYTHEVLYVNKSMAQPYGGPEVFKGKRCWEVLFKGQGGPCEFCPQKKIVDEEGNPTKVYTWDYERALDGSWFRVFSAAFRWIDGRLAHVVSSANITDNIKNAELAEYLANYDSLTDLPNRRMLVADCDHRINLASEGTSGYVLFFDVDGFKAVNDTLGHNAGDELLIQISTYFKSEPILHGNIYRNGGDEFVAIIDGEIGEERFTALVSKIQERFNQPWKLKARDVTCTISMGVAHYPEDGKDAEELIAQADKAMYSIKNAGGAGCCYARAMNHEG